MNANPFYERPSVLSRKKATKESPHVYVFVLSEDKSLFSKEARFAMVQKGVAHLPNVTVPIYRRLLSFVCDFSYLFF